MLHVEDDRPLYWFGMKFIGDEIIAVLEEGRSQQLVEYEIENLVRNQQVVEKLSVQDQYVLNCFLDEKISRLKNNRKLIEEGNF